MGYRSDVLILIKVPKEVFKEISLDAIVDKESSVYKALYDEYEVIDQEDFILLKFEAEWVKWYDTNERVQAIYGVYKYLEHLHETLENANIAGYFGRIGEESVDTEEKSFNQGHVLAYIRRVFEYEI